jgi:membrane peptidoglycan carboxypeptidase
MKTIKRLIILILIVGAFVAGGITYKAYDMYKEVTEATPIREKVTEIRSQKHYTAYSQLPDTYVDAVIAVEDRRFRTHHGFDIISTARAIVRDIKSGELKEGGSTITQQLARNMYFDQDKSLSRKIAEVMIAMELEKSYTKEEIFELYVNTIYFGSGYYNIYDASMGYFRQVPAMLNEYQCTMLAGIPQAPSVYSLNANPDLAEERRQQVIGCMVEAGYIDEGEIQ